MFADHAGTDGGVMDGWWEEHDGDTDGDGQVDEHETGLILIKPDVRRRGLRSKGRKVTTMCAVCCVLYGVLCTVYSMWCALCAVRCVLCTVCAVCCASILCVC